MKKILGNKKLMLVIALGIFVLFTIVNGVVSQRKSEKEEKESDKVTDEILQEMAEAQGDEADSMLMQIQDDLVADYGKVPEGYIWDVDGTLLSLGDKDMSAEDVVYAYFRGLQSLDMSMVQKYSRESLVEATYSGYYDENDKNTDYTDSFLRKMYTNSLLSMQVLGVESTSNFAENKRVFTVKVKMLDLTDKDFWRADRLDIYKNLQVYSSDESDSTKADIYLYDYISSYYSSGLANLRDVSFDVTVQKYPDLNTGWLVSVDTDIDQACRYADGKLVVSYIMEQFRDEGAEVLEAAKQK